VRTYRDLFGVAEFRAIFAAQCLTVASASIGSLALGTIVYDATGNAIASGLALCGGPLIRLVASWFLLSASDLLRPRTALGVTALVGLAADLLQALPGLPWWTRFVILALPWVVMSATGGAALALVADIVPRPAFVLGRATLNIAVGGMQIVGYAAAGVLLIRLSTSGLFLCAAAASAGAVVLITRGIADHPPRAASPSPIRRSRALNRRLLASADLRPVLLANWLPNGLIVGCESLFVPLAGRHAGYLYAATAAGMLAGDILVGRFVPERTRDRWLGPLRFLLAAPYLVMLLRPPLALAAAAAGLASVGYAASLPLQERLVAHSSPDERGQVLGLNGTGLLAFQGVGAVVAGSLAQMWGSGPAAARAAIGVTAALSLAAAIALIPSLRRTSPQSQARPARSYQQIPPQGPARCLSRSQ
jgi:MFS family permease